MPYLNPDYALQCEETLLDDVVAGRRDTGCLIWSTFPCLVTPRSYSRNECFANARRKMKAIGWPVYVRPTGGDVTPQGPGTLNVSTVFRMNKSENRSLDDIYRWLCEPLISWAGNAGQHAGHGSINRSFCDGRFNVAVEGRKLAGTAQRWRACASRNGDWAVLAHAIILVDAAIEIGVSAVNRFYESCGIEDRVDPDAHINFSETRAQGRHRFDLSDCEAELWERYKAALERTTSRRAAPKQPIV